MPTVNVYEESEEPTNEPTGEMAPDEFEKLLMSILRRHHEASKEEVVEAFFKELDGRYNTVSVREALDAHLQKTLEVFREGLKKDYAEFESRKRMSGRKKIGAAVLATTALVGTYAWGRKNGLKIGRLENG